MKLTVIGWNVESGGARPGTIAASIAKETECDIWGLSEVMNAQWAEQFRAAAEEGTDGDCRSILGTTCEGDRLLVVYNNHRLELLGYQELHHININMGVRSPLVARFRIRGTDREFLFMNNHLCRCLGRKAKKRHKQARQINQWGARQTLPVIAAGDYNFDWEVEGGDRKHGKGYDLMTAKGVFEWVRPETFVSTHCDARFNTVIDFVFVAGSAKEWNGTSRILFPEPSYCPDGPERSDHRPVLATFHIDALQ